MPTVAKNEAMKAVTGNKNSKVQTLNNEIKLTIKLQKARRAAELCDNFL